MRFIPLTATILILAVNCGKPARQPDAASFVNSDTVVTVTPSGTSQIRPGHVEMTLQTSTGARHVVIEEF
jgi:hypothetical protein